MSRCVGVIACALALAACDEGSNRTGTVRDRNEAVVSSAAQPTPTATVAASAVKKTPRALCTSKPRGKAPDARIDTATAPNADAPPTPVPFGAGKWIWVNLWAAWCGPCKEEMPRLLKWQAELRKSGILLDFAFVSMDDDERQMRRFLASQPEGGVRSTYWLKEGSRAKWLGPLGISESATLPVHALVSPKGEVACVIDGALDDEDFPRISAVLRGG